MRLSPSIQKILKSVQGDISGIRASIAALIAPRPDIQELASSIRNADEADQLQREHDSDQLVSLRAKEQVRKTGERYSRRYQRKHYVIQVWLAIGTWLAFAAAAIYAGLAAGQWHTMNKTYAEISAQTKSAQSAAYATCLNAQAAQATFLQIQAGARDSHATTAATVEQAAAGIEAERAFMFVSPKFPTSDDLFDQSELVIPYTVRNEGKSRALSVDIKAKAVLFGEKEPFNVTDKNFEITKIGNFPAGSEWPSKPQNPQQKAFTVSATVRDTKGRVVPVSSPEAKDFLGGGTEIVAFYGSLMYPDFAGTHKVRFCIPVYISQPGTKHRVGNTEADCGKYNHQDDKYAEMPSISTPRPIETRITPINCTKPKD